MDTLEIPVTKHAVKEIMERTAIKHVDTVLTTQHVIMRTVSVHKAVQLVTRHTRVIQLAEMEHMD